MTQDVGNVWQTLAYLKPSVLQNKLYFKTQNTLVDLSVFVLSVYTEHVLPLALRGVT